MTDRASDGGLTSPNGALSENRAASPKGSPPEAPERLWENNPPDSCDLSYDNKADTWEHRWNEPGEVKYIRADLAVQERDAAVAAALEAAEWVADDEARRHDAAARQGFERAREVGASGNIDHRRMATMSEERELIAAQISDRIRHLPRNADALRKDGAGTANAFRLRKYEATLLREMAEWAKARAEQFRVTEPLSFARLQEVQSYLRNEAARLEETARTSPSVSRGGKT